MASYPYQPYGNINPYAQNPYLQNPYAQQMMQQPAQQQTQQIQNGGFVSVKSQKEAFDYPVAPGNSITFIDENAMRCYIKTKGFSPFEQPRFDTYKLVKEEAPVTAQNSPSNAVSNNAEKNIAYATKDEFDAALKEIDALKERLDELTIKKAPPKKKEGDAA